MSQREVLTELMDLRKATGKAKMRTQSDHAKKLHTLTAYTHMFDPMGQLTMFLERGHAFRDWCATAKDPDIRAYALSVADLHIGGLEWHMARWQGQDQIYYDDDQVPGRTILYKETDRTDMPGLDDL